MREPFDLLGLDRKGTRRHHVISSLCRRLDHFSREWKVNQKTKKWIRRTSGGLSSNSALPTGRQEEERDSHTLRPALLQHVNSLQECITFITRMLKCTVITHIWIELNFSAPPLPSENTLRVTKVRQECMVCEQLDKAKWSLILNITNLNTTTIRSLMPSLHSAMIFSHKCGEINPWLT